MIERATLKIRVSPQALRDLAEGAGCDVLIGGVDDEGFDDVVFTRRRSTDGLHETPALQWAYAALVECAGTGGPFERWYREAQPTIARLLERAIASDKGGGVDSSGSRAAAETAHRGEKNSGEGPDAPGTVKPADDRGDEAAGGPSHGGSGHLRPPFLEERP